jgi:hypothetical protein
MAHQLVDDSGRDASVLEPGRASVAEVVGAQGSQHSPGGWSKRDGWVGQLGHGTLVGAVQVVAGQNGPGASGHARPVVAARPLRAGEHQILGVVARW